MRVLCLLCLSHVRGGVATIDVIRSAIILSGGENCRTRKQQQQEHDNQPRKQAIDSPSPTRLAAGGRRRQCRRRWWRWRAAQWYQEPKLVGHGSIDELASASGIKCRAEPGIRRGGCPINGIPVSDATADGDEAADDPWLDIQNDDGRARVHPFDDYTGTDDRRCQRGGGGQPVVHCVFEGITLGARQWKWDPKREDDAP